ncbi:MAG: carbohydrate-binding family V/XII [Verrucomicrobiota bacterium]
MNSSPSRIHLALPVVITILSLPTLSIVAQENTPSPDPSTAPLTWPREAKSASETITMYQPQVEKWSGNQLEARAALSIQNTAAAQPTFGAVWFTARTDTDKVNRTVTLNDFQIAKISFPTATQDYQSLLAEYLPTTSEVVSLDRLQASLTVSDAESPAKPTKVKNGVPKIFVSQQPAVLILVDGKPVLRDTGQNGLLRIINSRALIVFDKEEGIYYLSIADRWYQSSKIDGTWTEAADAPSDALTAINTEASKNNGVDLYDQPGSDAQKLLSEGNTPAIYVSTTPASLIEIDGAPQWQPITDTNLLYAANTTNTVIKDIDDQSTYVLLAGRWFKAPSLESTSWEYVAHDSLPATFAKIPPNHPKGNALVSVANTPQAKEAAIANTVPQSATVTRDQATLDVQYDGDPQFEPIEATDLSYAVNTPTPVVHTAPSEYYACSNGVWFVSASPQGPWAVAATVAPAIYNIPPSCPIYYCTYVRVFGYTDTVVYVGYYPGYYGTYIGPTGCIVYGTGYAYNPYVGTVWIGPPATYGFGAGFRWGYATGFALGYASGAWCHPWWGPAGYGWGWGYRNVNININNYNIHCYNRWNSKAVFAHSGDRWYARAGNTRAIGLKNGNIYADHKGNVFRRDDGQWQYRNDGQWNNIHKPVKNAAADRLGGGGKIEKSLTDGHLQNRIRNFEQDPKLQQRFSQFKNSNEAENWLNQQRQSRNLGQSRLENFANNVRSERPAANLGSRIGSGQRNFGGQGMGGRGFGGFQGGGGRLGSSGGGRLGGGLRR